MDKIKALFKEASRLYNNQKPHHDRCRELTIAAHDKLLREAKFVAYGSFAGKPPVPYNIFEHQGVLSRPIRPDMFVSDAKRLIEEYDKLVVALQSGKWSDAGVIAANNVVYTAVMSVAACFDIWQRGSRKTPGTYFEILMASLLLQGLAEAKFTKHIPLADLLQDSDVAEAAGEDNNEAEQDDEESESSSVSTDLVIGFPNSKYSVVVPLKITTRERIVQPFAHQRILDAAFGEGRYSSLLVCISETQLDAKTRSVKQVCVPGTIKLFQKYLAPLGGIYYCDPPQRYLAADVQKIIRVKLVGEFFKDALTFRKD